MAILAQQNRWQDELLLAGRAGAAQLAWLHVVPEPTVVAGTVSDDINRAAEIGVVCHSGRRTAILSDSRIGCVAP